MTPEFGAHGVFLPTALAVAMMDCYFGQGPRFNNRLDPSPSTPKPAPEEEGEEQGRERLERTIRMINRSTEWTPKGAAVRKPPTEEEGEVQSPGAGAD